jgi:hypothetical protein
MADVVYWDVIVLTPKEWHGDELLSPPERSGPAPGPSTYGSPGQAG